MIFGNAFLARGDVALGANKSWVFLLLIDLKVQGPTIIGRGRDVTTVWAAARTHRDLQSFRVQRVHRRHAVTTHAVQVRMLSSFMPESAGRNPAAPCAEDRRIRYPHRGGQLRIEIDFRSLWQCQLMTNVAVARRRWNSGVGAVAGETHRMAIRRSLERSFLKPESIADIFRRFGHVFLARIPLGLISLVTDGAALWWPVLLFFLQRHRHEPTAGISSVWRRVKADDVDMLVMREPHTEFRTEISSLFRRIVNVAETGEQPAAGVFGTVPDVAVRANSRRRSFTRKKLFTMTIETGSVLGKISDIRKRCVAFTNFFPILRGNFVAGIAC